MKYQKRIEQIEQSSVIQREQRCIAALESHYFGNLSDADSEYLDSQFEQAGIHYSWDAEKLRVLGFDARDIAAIQRADYAAISDAGMGLVRNTPNDALLACVIVSQDKPR